MDIQELETWFQDRPKWLQDAARRLVQNGDLTGKDYGELLEICRREILDQSPAFLPLPAGSLGVQDTTEPLRLESIAEVQGINALSPTRPLEFGQEQLCVVYGRNGTGKSGYVRLLKHACGARHLGELEGDIFQETHVPQSARFAFASKGANEEAQWSDGPIKDLRGVDIYDTECGLIYVSNENETTYEPWLLRLFTRLTDLCKNMSELINDRISRLVSKQPAIPSEYASTKAGEWYLGISATTSSQSVEEKTTWTPAYEEELGNLNKRLAEANPAAKAASLRRHKKSLLDLKGDLQVYLDRLLDGPCEKYLAVKADAVTKRRAANKDAKEIFENAPLDGVGSDSWRLLWEAARRYSEEVYEGVAFPNLDEGARCVLCQRALDKESRDRFVSFEEFVKGELQRLADEAEKKVRDTAGLFPDLPTADALNTRMNAAGLEESTTRAKISDFSSTLASRKQTCLVVERKEEITPGPPPPEVLTHLRELAEGVEKEAAACDEDAKGQNRPEIEKRAKELAAHKWLNQERDAIKAEITRLHAVAILENMDRLTSTNALSSKKGKLAEDLVTAAYIKRFESELKELRGSSIKVELKRTGTHSGHVYHRVTLRNAKKDVKTSEILSEGEFRIVSLAAFLADTEGRGSKAPFIFDDPISSLDHEYEEATAQRLARLSTTRQVIVFTHRLSFIGFLEKYAKKHKLKPSIVCLSEYKIGEVSELAINLKKTDSTVNDLLNKHLKQVKKAYDEGDAAYEREAGVTCRNIRILLERVVEKDLLNEVVRRFNPDVQTKDKIQALAKIAEEDCKFIDDYLTRYSRYEHSQSDETPIKLPKPEEIEEDLNAIAEFIKKIKERNKQ